jgi:hypothetical protein
MNRPFTRVKEMEARAGKQWQEKVQVLESRQRDMEQKIRELQAQAGTGQDQQLILSPAQEKELENHRRSLAEVTSDLKQVRKNLRKDTDALEFRAKVVNIAAMPALIAFSGLGLAVFKSFRRGPR